MSEYSALGDQFEELILRQVEVNKHVEDGRQVLARELLGEAGLDGAKTAEVVHQG